MGTKSLEQRLLEADQAGWCVEGPTLPSMPREWCPGSYAYLRNETLQPGERRACPVCGKRVQVTQRDVWLRAHASEYSAKRVRFKAILDRLTQENREALQVMASAYWAPTVPHSKRVH